MNHRKWIALCLCVLMTLSMFAGVAQADDADCPHADVGAYERIVRKDETCYESIDDGYHNVINVDKYRRVFCYDCWVTLSDTPIEENLTIREEHSYADNVCELCGHVNACEHANVRTEDSYRTTEDTGYEPFDNVYHTKTNLKQYRATYCNDCRTQIGWDLISENASKEWRHSYNEEGVCEQCGHVNACEHADVDVVTSTRTTSASEYVALNNVYHKQTHLQVYENTYCNDCERMISSVLIEEDAEREYNHNYDEEGVCWECGHVNTCAHSATSVGEHYEWTSASEYVAVDNMHHNAVHVRLYSTVYCSECEWQVSITLIDEDGVWESLHSYDDEDGVCWECGHVNTCTHENVHEGDWYEETEATEYIAIDNATHQVTNMEYWIGECCYDCNMWVSETLVQEGVFFEEYHEYDADGVCGACGHVNTCTHENVNTWEEIIEGEKYTALNAKYHSVTGPLYRLSYCKDCWMSLTAEWVAAEATRNEMHYFDGNGKCYECGYVNTCTHGAVYKHKYVTNETGYEPIDANYHSVNGRLYENEICSLCGEILSERQVSTAGTMTEEHWFGSSGKCLCGYVSTCAHEHQSTTTWINPKDFGGYAPLNEKEHTTYGTLCSRVDCADCGATVGEIKSVQDASMAEGHEFIDGVCMQCGYVNTCAHEHRAADKNISYGSFADLCENAEMCDATDHYVYGQVYEEEICTDCGELLSIRATGENVLKREHIYYEGSVVCRVCGYVKGGAQLDGWVNVGGQWYYYQNSRPLTNCWMQDAKGWCYLGATGAMVTNAWVEDSKGWCYLGSDGHAVTNCWKQDSIGWCYLDGEGSMVKNAWVQTDGKWYFLDENGYRVTNSWRKDSNGWCYLGSDGAMVTNAWVMDSKGWCYLGENGYAVTNCWKKDSAGWCYLDGEGSMVKNAWVQTDGKWYYLNENGYRVTSAWRKDSTGWCYLGSDGAMVTNAWVMDSKGWCYLGSNGYAVTNCWKQDSAGWCYLDGDGSMTKNAWVQTDGQWYYLNGDGYRVTGAATIDGTEYVFGEDGALIG